MFLALALVSLFNGPITKNENMNCYYGGCVIHCDGQTCKQKCKIFCKIEKKNPKKKGK